MRRLGARALRSVSGRLPDPERLFLRCLGPPPFGGARRRATSGEAASAGDGASGPPPLGSGCWAGGTSLQTLVLPDWNAGTVGGVWRRRRHEVAQRLGLEEQIEVLMDRYDQAGKDYAGRAAVLEEYLALAYSHPDGVEMFEVNGWAQTLAEDYLASGRVDDAVRVVVEATSRGHGEDAVMLCELAEKLMRSGHEPTAHTVWERARAEYGHDVWIYVQAGIEYGDLGDHATALAWLTPGTELAVRTADPHSALEQLVPLRAAALAALRRAPDELQARADHTLAQQATPGAGPA